MSTSHGLTTPVLPGDFTCLARALLDVHPQDRAEVAADYIRRAMVAQQTRLRTGKGHAVYGNGSIMAAVRGDKKLPPEPYFTDRDYLDCMSVAIDALRDLADDEIKLAERKD